MTPTIHVDSIVFRRDEEEDTDGYVIYLVLKPCSERPCRHICATHPEREHHYERQLFRRGSFGHRKNGSEADKAANRANVWGWDGNEASPTLSPSFLGDRTEYPGYRLHHFLVGGQISLCGDATVEVVAPIACVDRFEGEDGG